MGVDQYRSRSTRSPWKNLPPQRPTTPTKDVIVTLDHRRRSAVALGQRAGIRHDRRPSSDSIGHQECAVGLQFTPMLYFPLRTTFIPYYYLVFDTNDLFLDAGDGAARSTPRRSRTRRQSMRRCRTARPSQDRGARTTIVDTLKTLGFDALALINSGALSDPGLRRRPATDLHELDQRNHLLLAATESGP